jgi:hypothetical protein
MDITHMGIRGSNSGIQAPKRNWRMKELSKRRREKSPIMRRWAAMIEHSDF